MPDLGELHRCDSGLGWAMTLGRAERQGRLGSVAVARCEAELPERSIYRLLHAERDRQFPDELFADLYVHHGRRSAPPSILAAMATALLADLPAGPAGDPPPPTIPAPVVYGDAAYRPAVVAAWRASAVPAPSARCGLLHQQPGRADRHRPPARGPAGCGQAAAAQTGLAGRLPRLPAHRGAQARPPAAPPPWRPTSPRPGPGAGRAGLAAAGRRGQPGPLRRPRRAHGTGRQGRHASMNRKGQRPAPADRLPPRSSTAVTGHAILPAITTHQRPPLRTSDLGSPTAGPNRWIGG
jgi:hypothetical protein